MNCEYSHVEMQEDASRLIASAAEHIERARTSLESAAGAVPAYDQTLLLLKVAHRFAALADMVKQLAEAFAQRSI